jgi:hypothetical protein
MLFSLEKAGVSDSPRTHCGVSEFTSEEDTVWVPSWVLQKLQATSGTQLQVRLVQLELGTFAKLKPDLDVLQDQHDPRIALEHGLQAFMALSVHDRIPIAMPDGRQTWWSVEELRPAPAVCIVNTDLRLELDAPEAPVRDASVLKVWSALFFFLYISVSGLRCVRICTQVNSDALGGELQPGQYAYFRFVAPKPSSIFARKDFIIKCDAAEGDPDVYVSCDDSNKFPSMVCSFLKSVVLSFSYQRLITRIRTISNGEQRMQLHVRTFVFLQMMSDSMRVAPCMCLCMRSCIRPNFLCPSHPSTPTLPVRQACF